MNLRAPPSLIGVGRAVAADDESPWATTFGARTVIFADLCNRAHTTGRVCSHYGISHGTCADAQAMQTIAVLTASRVTAFALSSSSCTTPVASPAQSGCVMPLFSSPLSVLIMARTTSEEKMAEMTEKVECNRHWQQVRLAPSQFRLFFISSVLGW